MHARVTTYEGPPERMEEGIRIYREEVIPWLRDSTGFRGWIALLDHEASRAFSITFWATKEAMADEAATGSALRDELAANIGATMIGLEEYEVAAAEALGLGETD
ncbi:MAG TPA: hypothetical protein VD704_01400 [Gaiellaceae bacterium]|nr:hypothetical protein [Gaiellaceae bacterium]